MAARKIMVIRHAEKPDDAGTIFGITIEGHQDSEELSVRGWQRAGALATFFAPPDDHFREISASRSRSWSLQVALLPTVRVYAPNIL